MYFNIRGISRVKHHLTEEACAIAINATVISHLDYHLALLLGITDRQMHQLQVAQTCYIQSTYNDPQITTSLYSTNILEQTLFCPPTTHDNEIIN